ncbi:MAG: hypothetical protein KDE27_15475 [Planctomycetes bacterium]|nr:hypothetical protein [Planctomycetota bacterium]
MRRPTRIAGLVALGASAAALTAPLHAQDWIRLHPATSPPGLLGHAMAYDGANDRTVLFGGSDGVNRLADTWLYDGSTWAQVTPANSPPPRAGHPLAYDAVRGRVVLFGGIGVGTGAMNDTWEWDGTNWLQMTPATVPPGRLSHPLVWHPGRASCVMHGGNGLGTTLTDTWEWNGVDWTAIVTANVPMPLRFASDMAYDPIGNGLVLFSGYPNAPADTWYFDNFDWIQLTTSNVPPGRWDHQMTTDTVRNRIVLWGGTVTADTWEFDGTDWLQQTPATLPPARLDGYLVYDTTRGRAMLYGGDALDDTWAYLTPQQPGFAASIPYGEGCVDEASASFYENFLVGTFDLSNTTMQLLPSANGYTAFLVPATTQWFTPTSTPLSMGDETNSGPLPLGFTLPYPGGSTTYVDVSSNGFVRALSSGNAQYYQGVPDPMFTDVPRWCPYWSDLDPSAGGSVHFDIDPSTNGAVVTFLNVPEYNSPGSGQTFQIVFLPGGVIEMRYMTCASVLQPVLAGWTPGGGAADPGSIDITTLTIPIMTSPDKTALWHEAELRPVVGNSVPLLTGPIPASALLTATVFGLTEYTMGIDLTALGMPSCHQYTSVDAVQLNLPANGLARGMLTVPSSTTFVGVQIKSQAASLVPGYNAVGAIASNGIRHTIDVN